MTRPALDPIARLIESTLHPGAEIRYSEASAFCTSLETLAEERISPLIKGGEAARAATLYELFIVGCHEKIEEVDDSSGEMGQVVDALFVGLVRARQAAGADPAQTADLLLRWIEADNYGLCHDVEKAVVPVMDEAGVEALRQATQQRRPEQASSYSGYRYADVLRAVYARQGDVAAFTALAEASGAKPADCLALAQLHQRQGAFQEALSWVERGLAQGRDIPWDMERVHKELLLALGRGQEVLDAAWAKFRAYPSESGYEDLMKLVPEDQRPAWHQRAMEATDQARELSGLLPLWQKLGEQERLIARLQAASDEELERMGHFMAETIAQHLQPSHPIVAARLFRAQALRIIDRGKSKYYEEALECLRQARECYEQGGQPESWTELVHRLQQEHSRKRGLIASVAGIARSVKPEPAPSFLERAQQRWPKGRT